MWRGEWSEQLIKQAVWLGGQVEDDFAEQILQQIGGIAISDTTLWRIQQVWNERIRLQAEAQRAAANAVPDRNAPVPGHARDGERLGAALDGAMINIREEGWKELKVGCVFEMEMRRERDAESGEWQERAHAVDNTYCARLGGPEIFGQDLWREASHRQWTAAADTIVLGDGAPWIWNLVQEHFSDSWQVVDWYHAKQHLYHAAHLAFGLGSPEAVRWAKGLETSLFLGQAWQVAESIRQLARVHRRVAAELRKEAQYFTNNQRRMEYLQVREEGWPIGSGMVESGCKQFRARFVGPGMRWSRAGAERLIPVRAAILSKRFDQVWAAAYKKPPQV